MKASVGQYLAGDKGGTLEIAKRFDSGVVVGGYATITNVSKEEYGEGDFTKGVYVSTSPKACMSLYRWISSRLARHAAVRRLAGRR